MADDLDDFFAKKDKTKKGKKKTTANACDLNQTFNPDQPADKKIITNILNKFVQVLFMSFYEFFKYIGYTFRTMVNGTILKMKTTKIILVLKSHLLVSCERFFLWLCVYLFCFSE